MRWIAIMMVMGLVFSACDKKPTDKTKKEEKPTAKETTNEEKTPSPKPKVVKLQPKPQPKPQPTPVVQKKCQWTKDCDAAKKEVCFKDKCFTQAQGEAYCWKQKGCKSSGDCGFFKSACRPTKPEHCLGTEYCERGGCTYEIKWEVGKCTTSDASCAKSDYCKKHGRCWKIGQMCGAKKDSDCTKSEGCKKLGRCKRYGWNCAT